MMRLPTIALLFCSLAAAAASVAAQESAPATAADLPPYRVLVMTGSDDDAGESARRISESLGNAIRAAGFRVMDGEQARLLARRQQTIMRSWVGDRDRGLEQQLALLTRCDVIAKVTLDPPRRRKQQGRYSVRQNASFKIVYADSPEQLASGEGRGEGRTLDSYDEAQRKARKQLTDVDDGKSLAAQIVAELRRVRENEAKDGARLTVALYADTRCQPILADIGKAVAGADGVVPGSYQQLASDVSVAFDGNQRGMCAEAEVRCRGGIAVLQESVLEAVRRIGKVVEEQDGLDLQPVVVASGRRLDVVIRVAEAASDLNKEVDRVLKTAVGTIYSRYGTALTQKRLAVVPASIGVASTPSAAIAAFRSAYLNKYAEVEARLAEQGKPDADPRSAAGTVTVHERQFENLGAAEDELTRMQRAFDESQAGNLANEIAALVEKNFDAVSKGGISIQPLQRDRDRAIDFIKVEAAACTEEGAVDADTVAFYQQNGSDFLVSTRLRKFLDEYAVTVTVLELGSGERMQGSASFHPRFTEALLAHLGS